MTRREQHITNVLRSRGIGVLIVITAFWMVWSAFGTGSVAHYSDSMAAAFPVPSEWIGDGTISLLANLTVITGTAAMMIAINRQFNLLKTMSVFFAAFFIFITCSTPVLAAQSGASSILAAIVMLCMWIMFTIYNERRSDRRIYLIFTLLSSGVLIQYAFIFYIPVFMVGIAQMRIFRFKKIMAALLGLLTPPWIVWGLGLLPPPHIPALRFTPPEEIFSTPGGLPFLITVGLTMLTGFFLGSLNLIRILGFNARSRAFNGLLSLIAITTGVLAVVNFTNLMFYVTLLNATVAFQVGHFFRFTASHRGYILILALLACYAGLYTWSIIA